MNISDWHENGAHILNGHFHASDNTSNNLKLHPAETRKSIEISKLVCQVRCFLLLQSDITLTRVNVALAAGNEDNPSKCKQQYNSAHEHNETKTKRLINNTLLPPVTCITWSEQFSCKASLAHGPTRVYDILTIFNACLCSQYFCPLCLRLHHHNHRHWSLLVFFFVGAFLFISFFVCSINLHKYCLHQKH